MDETRHDISQLLLEWREGDSSALSSLMPLVFDELRRIAGLFLGRERSCHTLQPTALVHEAYLRLVAQDRLRLEDRAHFFAFAARVMRRILVDHARKRGARKRGYGELTVSLAEVSELAADSEHDLVAVNDALEALARIDQRQGRIVELRFFAGLTYDEIGKVLGISARTVKREWSTARYWLYREIYGATSDGT